MTSQKSDVKNDTVFSLGSGKGITLEVGSLTNSTSKICGTLYDDSNIFRKVGTNSTCIARLTAVKGTIEVEEGTFYLNGSNLPTALKLTGKGAELYVTNTLDASSLVASSLAAYTVKSEDYTDGSTYNYKKYTLELDESATIVATSGTGDDIVSYTSIADALAAVADGEEITLVGNSAETLTLAAGKTLNLAFGAGANFTGTITAADGTVVADGSATAIEAGATTASYTCPELFTATNSLTGTTTLSGDYFSDNQMFVPKETAGAVATLNIGSDSSLRVKNNIRIASKGNTVGRINVTSGGALTHDTTGNLMIGGASGANGMLNIAGGVFTNATANVNIGYGSGGNGKVTLSSGGFALPAGTMCVGQASGATGEFEMTGGTFSYPATTLDPIKIGTTSGATGTVMVAGTADLTLGKLPVGNTSGSVGFLDVAGSGKLTVTNDFVIGATGATGTMTISGGEVNVAGNGKLLIGDGTGTGEVIADGGSFSTTNEVRVAQGGGATGTLTIKDGGDFYGYKLVLGQSAAGVGTVNVEGGKLVAAGVHLAAHATSTNLVSVSGGELYATNRILIADIASNTSSRMEVTGGTVGVTNNINIAQGASSSASLLVNGEDALVYAKQVNIANGTGATGVLTISNGTLKVTSDDLKIGVGATSSGTLNLCGGTLNACKVQKGDGTTAALNFDGGTLQAAKANTVFVQEAVTCTVKEGGATIDTQSYDVTVKPALAHDSELGETVDGGLTKKGSGMLTLETAPTFTGAITIEEDGGSVYVPSSATYTLGTATRKSGTSGTYDILVYGYDAEISDVSFDYFASYTNADVTASVTAPGTYTLTVDGNNYSATAEAAGTITFANVDTSSATIGGSLSYTIAATGTTSGSSSGSATVGTAVDGTGWMKADATSTVGSWTDANGDTETLTYVEDAASLSGTNTYHPVGVSTGEVVTVTTKVSFGAVADEDATISADSQAAIKVASINSVNTFQVLTNAANTVWASVYNDTLGAPDPAETNTVTIALNYMTQTYSVSITKDSTTYPLTNELNESSFPLASGASSVRQVEYRGSFDFVSLAGSYVSIGYTADVNADATGVSATNVIVSTDFVTNYMSTVKAGNIATALVADRTGTGNGLSYFASYALGLDPTDEEDVPLVDVQTDAEGNFIVTLKDKDGNTLDVANNVAVTLQMLSGTDPNDLTTTTAATSGTGESASFTITPSEISGTVQYYRVQVNIGAK